MFAELVSVVMDVAMVFAPLIGYVDQYRQIVKARDSSGFSKMVSLVLLLANILRIYFWMGKRFETALLLQSISMVIAQFIMLEVCIRFGNKSGKGSTITDLDFSQFWNWSDLFSYGAFIALFALAVGTLSLFLIPMSTVYVELLGFFALATEACLGLPQVVKNYSNQSVQGLSTVLLATWFLGDGYKTVYFVFKNQPAQFIACGAFQLMVDCVLLFQFIHYSRRSTVVRNNARREEQILINK
jgi:hypothetical protein